MPSRSRRLVVGVAVAVLAVVLTAQDAPRAALRLQSEPQALRRVALNDIVYEGAFRLPREDSGGDHFDFGGKPVAYNPASQSLFVGSFHGRMAEVTIPRVVNSSSVDELPFAEYRQGFSDPMEGHTSDVSSTDAVGLSGAVIAGGRVYGTASIYYDAGNSQRLSHFSHGLPLAIPGFQGWSSVWEPARTGLVAGFMALIPQEWQELLGGNVLSGQCCIPIVSRTSWGPAAFAFKLSDVGTPLVNATPLLFYDSEHPTLGLWDESNESYGIATGMGGVAVIAGTRTALYFGRNGLGQACYGTGTGNQSLDGQPVGDGSKYCYDPTDPSKGTHAYPYRYQIWAYDLNDFAAVRAGTKSPWEVVPYGVWPFDFPIYERGISIGGVGYDALSNRVYLTQMWADVDGAAYRPIVHVLRIR